jgi:drug/metabolite transporter (DMT)-like permease
MSRFRRYNIDLGLAFVVLVWGFSPTVFKIAFRELQPLTFIFFRFLILSLLSIVVLLVYRRRSGRTLTIRRQDIGLLILSGLCGYGLYQLLYMVGLAHTTVFASALLVATVPLWSVIIVALLRMERVHPAQWLGIVIGLLGVAWFLSSVHSQPEVGVGHTLTQGEILFGDLLTLVGVMLFTLYGIVNKRLAVRYSPPELMCYTLCIGTAVLIPFCLPSVLSQNWSTVTWRTWAIIPYTVLFPIYLTYSIWNWAIGKRGVGYVTLYNYAIPVIGGLVGFLVLREALTPVQMGAGAIVLCGMLVARWAVARNIASRKSRAVAAVAPADATVALPVVAEIAEAIGTMAVSEETEETQQFAVSQTFPGDSALPESIPAAMTGPDQAPSSSG